MIPALIVLFTYLLLVGMSRAGFLALGHFFGSAVGRVSLGGGQNLGLETHLGNHRRQFGRLDFRRIETYYGFALFGIQLIDTIHALGCAESLAQFLGLFGVIETLDRKRGVETGRSRLRFGLDFLGVGACFAGQGAFASLETAASRSGRHRGGENRNCKKCNCKQSHELFHRENPPN